ncbi:MAG: hypothetical protein ACK4U0_07800 [Mesorhizobium sp.]
MSQILVLIGRLFAILVGYALAVLVASAFLHLVWSSGIGWRGDESSQVVVGSLAISAGFLALMFANFAFVPAIVAIGLSEVLGWRDWLTYALAGAVVAVVVTAAGRYGIDGGMFFEPPGPPRPSRGVPGGTSAFVEVVAAGLVAGIAYWLIAGRGAGSWRRPPRARIPPLP